MNRFVLRLLAVSKCPQALSVILTQCVHLTGSQPVPRLAAELLHGKPGTRAGRAEQHNGVD